MGRGGYGGRSRGRGQWPGNGPFRNLPPWERPGWLYGRGSCWYLGYQPTGSPALPQYAASDNPQTLQNQKDILEAQIKNLQESLRNIEKRLADMEKRD